MSGNQHFKTRTPSDADLKRDPGIGQSKGLDRHVGEEPIEGENSVEGDIENDTRADGSIDPAQRGRANR
jgi:hypothetical protein